MSTKTERHRERTINYIAGGIVLFSLVVDAIAIGRWF